MPDDETSHAACVRAWREDNARDLSPEAKRALFERALRAIWQRAHRTLGEVTLGAIVDRVLHDVREEFPLMSAVEVDAAGVRLGDLQQHEQLERLDDAMDRTLVGLLTLIGNLTADILTPGLHAALRAVSPRDTADTETGGSTR